MEHAIGGISEPELHAALDKLARRDADIRRALKQVGRPPTRQRPQGFATLLRVIVAQQISVKAAASIWDRLLERIGDPPGPERLLALDDTALRKAGLSRQKARYGRALAELVADGRLDLPALAHMAEEEAIEALCQVPGLGRWSAEIYLLFALGRADIWPRDDLGLMGGVQRLKRLPQRPNRAEMDTIAAPWQPWRGCAAIFLWHYYGATTLEDRSAAPAKPAKTNRKRKR
jgi:DNA-3-methyladenine glycosylase II